MTHRASFYVTNKILPKIPAGTPTAYKITHLEAANLASFLAEDCLDYLYSAFVSFADACRGLQAEYYSWSTVKLYYSAFYSARSILCASGISIFYDRRKPRILSAKAGSTVENVGRAKRDSTTHGAVIETFKRTFPNHPLLSQTIDLSSPPDWLRKRREEANYGVSKFVEPHTPEHFKQLKRSTLRKMLNAYADDDSHLYTFDPDHAMICLPLKFLQDIQKDIDVSKRGLTEEDKKFLGSLLLDQHGFIPLTDRIFK